MENKKLGLAAQILIEDIKELEHRIKHCGDGSIKEGMLDALHEKIRVLNSL